MSSLDESRRRLGAGKGEFVCVEVRTECPKCGASVPLDGPERDVSCSSCSAEVRISQQVFHAAVANAEMDIYRLGRGVTVDEHGEHGGMEVFWSHGTDSPPCPVCGGRTRPSDDYTKITCADHGEQGAIEKAPDWFTGLNSHIEGFVPPPEPVEKAVATQKVSLTCSNCGSSLTADGSRRAVECAYCDTLNVLPDEVWKALRPPRVPKRWWLALSMYYDPRKETPTASEEIKDGLGTLGCGLLIFLPIVFVAIAAAAALHGWLVEKFGLAGFYVFVGVLGLVLIGLVAYCIPYARRYFRWRKVWKAEYEVVGRFDSWIKAYGDSGIAKVVLTPPGEPDSVLTSTFTDIMDRETFDRLGGKGGLIRAWTVPDRPELVEVQLTPTALE